MHRLRRLAAHCIGVAEQVERFGIGLAGIGQRGERFDHKIRPVPGKLHPRQHLECVGIVARLREIQMRRRIGLFELAKPFLYQREQVIGTRDAWHERGDLLQFLIGILVILRPGRHCRLQVDRLHTARHRLENLSDVGLRRVDLVRGQFQGGAIQPRLHHVGRPRLTCQQLVQHRAGARCIAAHAQHLRPRQQCLR